MRTVWKFEVPITTRPGETVEVEMPALSVRLHAEMHSMEAVSLWYEVETDDERMVRTFCTTPTGHPMDDPSWRWVATATHEDIVAHVWERR